MLLSHALRAVQGGGAIEFVAFAQASSNGQLIINKPTGTVEGDLMIAFMASSQGGGGVTWTGDTGWTEIAERGAQPSARIAYKVAGPSEGASYTFTPSASANNSGAILTYRNAAYDAIGLFASGANPLVPTGPTAAANNSVLIGFAARNNPSATITSTMTTQRAIDNDGSAPSWYIGDEEVSAGATGTRSFTVGTTSNVSAILLTIKPA